MVYQVILLFIENKKGGLGKGEGLERRKGRLKNIEEGWGVVRRNERRRSRASRGPFFGGVTHNKG